MSNHPAPGSSPRMFRGRVLFLALGLSLLSCTQAPTVQRLEAKDALREARDAGAHEIAADLVLASQEALDTGERWLREGEPVRARARFEAASRRAESALEIAELARAAEEDRARRVLDRAREGLREMNWLSAYLPPRSAIRGDIKRVEVSVREAEVLLERGDPQAALVSAHDASDRIARTHERFTRFVLGGADPDRRARYRRWVDETIAWSEKRRARAIIVDKMRRTLTLVSNGRRVRTYRAELGINGTQVKLQSGDRATPEGRYRITEKRGPGSTRWYKALLLNYPNEEDLKRFRRARKRGEVSRGADPGNLIEIHGKGGRGGDWTDGCVALSNADIDHLFARVSVNTPVTIVGFEVDDSPPDIAVSPAASGGAR